MTEQDQEQRAIQQTASDIIDRLVELVEDRDVCPHCVGIDVIYLIAKEIALNMDAVDPGELFAAVHLGLADGEVERRDQGTPESSGGWTVH